MERTTFPLTSTISTKIASEGNEPNFNTNNPLEGFGERFKSKVVSSSTPTKEETKISFKVVVHPLASVIVSEYNPPTNPVTFWEEELNPFGPVQE